MIRNTKESGRKGRAKILPSGMLLAVFIGVFAVTGIVSPSWAQLNPAAPSSPVRLVFVHHSTGENWLTDGNGNLGITLRDNNYFVSDTNYGWGPDESIGDTTDIGNWYDWFLGPNRDTYLAALFNESSPHSTYSRLGGTPGGENEIIMFKSCFPNSYISGNPGDLPAWGENPLRGHDAWSEHMTVANVKGIYNELLSYFASRQDKLFVVVTSPPLEAGETDAAHAANARAVTNWLVNDWLVTYPYRNVVVFNFFNVLTSNGGNVDTSDAGSETGNHHRYWNGTVQHIQTVNSNLAAYAWPGDSHPTTAGSQKATAEFVPLLNVFYHCWKGTGECPSKYAVDIFGNGTRDAITVSASTPVSIAVNSGSGAYYGVNADWWVAEQVGSQWRSYVYPTGWTDNLTVSYQGPFFDLQPPIEVFNGTLSPGTHVFYFGIDFTPDGEVSAGTLSFRPVIINVQ